MKTVREILDGLVYDKCCKTINKKKFRPYEDYIDQALSDLKSLIVPERIRDGVKNPFGKDYTQGYNNACSEVEGKFMEKK